jgi:hypothetical protein
MPNTIGVDTRAPSSGGKSLEPQTVCQYVISRKQFSNKRRKDDLEAVTNQVLDPY